MNGMSKHAIWLTTFSLIMVCPLAEAGDHGYIQVSSRGRYFRFEDGTPFFPIGQNDWPPVFDIRTNSDARLDTCFRHLRQHGVNALRLMVEAAKPNENIFVETRPGRMNPEFVRWMDKMVALATKHDVYLIVALYPNPV